MIAAATDEPASVRDISVEMSLIILCLLCDFPDSCEGQLTPFHECFELIVEELPADTYQHSLARRHHRVRALRTLTVAEYPILTEVTSLLYNKERTNVRTYRDARILTVDCDNVD